MFGSVFYELSAILIFAAVVAFIGLRLRQPLIVSFIAAGILAGPSVLNLVQETGYLDLMSELGISLLLFVVGLKLDLHLIRTTGIVALTTGLGQVIFTSVVGYFICLALGLSPLVSIYIAVALTFSSTIIVVKLLSDKGEIDALHGRVALGFLIVQDIVVVLVMIVLSAMGVGAETENGMALALALMLLKGVLFLGLIAAFIRWGARPLLDRLAGSPELMVLFAVGWAVALASVSDILGFSKEIGAFLAGVTLASTPFRDIIGSRLMSLRDFMLLFFFIELGAHMDLSTIHAQIVPALILSAFVLIGNPLIVMIIMGLMGYRKRTGFLAGLTVAQISEFSLIFAAMGMSIGHLDADMVGLVTLVGLITIALSTYMILYSQQLYARLAPFLGIFERRMPYRETGKGEQAGSEKWDVILFGLGRYGSNMARGLRQQGLSVLGIDFDPEAVRQWQSQGYTALYGDANDPNFASHLPLHDDQWVIAAVPAQRGALSDSDATRTLLRSLRTAGYRGRIAITAQRPMDIHDLKEAGADLVLLPFADAAHHAVQAVVDYRRGSPPHEHQPEHLA
ncbi:cation:proton antiporter [Telmatospirillum sp. J64-1]|uniref:cation:proton antiporter n=1 Tax=Telmatospirillum sp. J64-1 TaxID=2502183 RepID=UPI00115EF3AF|nr:cation:proton antiporter [Telmatospirillum sp. J64-1]